MSVSPVSDDWTSSKGYCDPNDDVAVFFEKFEDGFKAEGDPDQTDPTLEQVQQRILAESDWIDEYTGHAWRDRQVVNEYHNFEDTYYWRSGMPIKLQKRDIRTPLDDAEGDKIEFWQGDQYNEWVSDAAKTEGREGDYWVNEAEGFLYVFRRAIFFKRHKELRVTYRYGKEQVPQTVRDACARRVAAWFLEAQQYRITTPGNEEGPDVMAVAERWREITKQELKPFKEVKSAGIG